MLLRNNSLVEEIQDSVASNISGGKVDFNGDGSSDLAVVRLSPLGWTWFADFSPANGVVDVTVNFGAPEAIPIVGDFNSDLKTDIGAVTIFPGGGMVWNIDTNLDGVANITVAFGLAGDKIIADFV